MISDQCGPDKINPVFDLFGALTIYDAGVLQLPSNANYQGQSYGAAYKRLLLTLLLYISP